MVDSDVYKIIQYTNQNFQSHHAGRLECGGKRKTTIHFVTPSAIQNAPCHRKSLLLATREHVRPLLTCVPSLFTIAHGNQVNVPEDLNTNDNEWGIIIHSRHTNATLKGWKHSGTPVFFSFLCIIRQLQIRIAFDDLKTPLVLSPGAEHYARGFGAWKNTCARRMVKTVFSLLFVFLRRFDMHGTSRHVKTFICGKRDIRSFGLSPCRAPNVCSISPANDWLGLFQVPQSMTIEHEYRERFTLSIECTGCINTLSTKDTCKSPFVRNTRPSTLVCTTCPQMRNNLHNETNTRELRPLRLKKPFTSNYGIRTVTLRT